MSQWRSQEKEVTTTDFIPDKQPVKILMTSGASCPDAMVEKVIEKISGFYLSNDAYEKSKDSLLQQL